MSTRKTAVESQSDPNVREGQRRVDARGESAARKARGPRAKAWDHGSRESAKEPSLESPLLRVEDAARYLGISPTQMRRLLWSGSIPTIRIKRSVRVSKADLDAFIQKCRVDGGER